MLSKQRQKKSLPAMLASTKKYRMFLLCFALILGLTFSVFLPQVLAASSNRQAIRETLSKTSEVVDSANLIYERLQEIIAEEIVSMESEEDDETETDISESEEGFEELTGYKTQLDGLLADLKGLPDDPNTSEGKTVCAAREYLTMLKNMSVDLAELVRYDIDMYLALQPMDEIDYDFEYYQDLALSIWSATREAKPLMEAIKPPSYLAITHKDIILRVTEYNEYGEDFYSACQMGDWLRIYSCIYRFNRIARMFSVCDENLTDDIALQLNQAERRLSGPIDQLREELERNLNLLNNAQGGK